MTPLSELLTWLQAHAARLRLRRQYIDGIDVEVAQEIAAEVGECHRAASATAHRAEVSDLEAARLLTAAQRPDSDGGRLITPREAAPISRCILRSARLDHDLGEHLAT